MSALEPGNDVVLQPQQDEPGNKRRNDHPLVTVFKGLVRLILVILVGAALGLLVYLSYALVFRDLVLKPSSDIQQSLSVAETRQALTQERVDDRLSEYNERLSVLESQHSLDAETISELQSDVEALQLAVESQTALLERIAELEATVVDIFAQAELMNEQIEENTEGVQHLQATLQSEGALSSKAENEALLREVRLLHALELLDRSRLYLLQNNLGLASQDILLARELLLLIYEDAPQDQQVLLVDWIDRLEGVAGLLPRSPGLASTDLEMVWNRMILGLDAAEIDATLTPLNLLPEGGQESPSPTPGSPSATPEA